MKLSGIFTGKGILAAALALLVAGTSAAIYLKERPDTSHVRASGTVEVTQVQLAPLVGGRIVELAIEESDKIEKGQFVARLSMDGADDDVRMAEQALAAARAQLAELRSGFRKEDIARARAEVAARRAQYEQAKRDEERFAALAADGVVAARDAELASEQSKAAYNVMKAAAEQLRLLENGPRPEQIAAAEANAARAEAAYEKAKTLVSYALFAGRGHCADEELRGGRRDSGGRARRDARRPYGLLGEALRSFDAAVARQARR